MVDLKRKRVEHVPYDFEARGDAYQVVRALPQATDLQKQTKIAALKEFIEEEEELLVNDPNYLLKRSGPLDAANRMLSNLEQPMSRQVGYGINFFLTATEFRFREPAQQPNTLEIDLGFS